MRKRNAAPGSAKKKSRKETTVDGQRSATPKEAGPAISAATPEVRRAIPLDYATTEEVNLRRGPGADSEELSGGLLAKDTVVKIAPQEWWFVEVAEPMGPAGSLKGWVRSDSLRRTTAADESGAPPVPEAIAVASPGGRVLNPEVRKKIAESILNFEARRDSKGHLAVNNLPPTDGEGRFEVAGINERYDPEEAAKLRELINAGQYDEAEREATEYIAQYTDVVAKWTTVPAIEAYLRDCAFDRGPGGAAKILQMALGVTVDGEVGPETLGALRKAEKNPARLLVVLRVAREHYELRVVGRREEFWKEMVNRWDKSLAFAQGVA